jgi:hypothetical protein
MIEELNSTFAYKVEKEVFKQTADYRTSAYDKEAENTISPDIMERLVEK